HYEGELAVVIGRICRRVPPERVTDVVFGYTVANDVTCRDLQNAVGQWTRAKGFDSFCPLGPWIATHISIEEAGRLDLLTSLNDEPVQAASTSQMVRGIPELISYISSFTTLLPGDVVLTGTPSGIGEIVAGDTVEVRIEGIGSLINTVVQG
ncbi:MAG: fumarylacetoacetate hydrolase family protein, partial [Coriobacteriia bacterium]|nr:fumarylacetoacetate hydrolase family protein [Coriobacteriia bacterium]